MPVLEQDWVVMVRDLSGAVHIEDDPVVFGAMVVGVTTGLVLGSAIATGPLDALVRSLETAATDPPGLPPPGCPKLVRCPEGLASTVQEVLAAAFPGDVPPQVLEGAPVAGAEDLFDALVGHLAGRSQPEETPEPEEWAMAIAAVLAYRQQAPWQRWSDTVALGVDLETPEGTAAYVATVLGAEGVQHGLVLHPGDASALDAFRDPHPTSLPPGTILVLLDEPASLPGELVGKAHRYGWPAGDDLVPALLATAPTGGPADPGRRELDHLVLAATAIVAHDRRGPVLVGDGDGTSGEIALAKGRRGRFSLHVLPDALVGRDGAAEADPPGRRRASPAAAEAGETIDALLEAFLADERARLSERTFRTYETIVDLLRDCLNGYGHSALTIDEQRRFEAAYEDDDEAFVHLFGADKIADNLPVFLGDFMVRKVLASAELLRGAGTVTGRLARWLGERGVLDEARAKDAARRARAAARDLPNAGRLTELLYEHARGLEAEMEGPPGDEVVDDLFVIERVEDGALYFDGGIGPVEVPAAASALARAGWMVTGCLLHRSGRWHLVEIGNVYPA